MVNCSIREQQRYTGELKLTWEVCQEDGISSYKMLQNPKYAVIDELRKEKMLLHTPTKSSSEGNDGVGEKGSSKYVYDETEQEQQEQEYENEQYNVVEQQEQQYEFYGGGVEEQYALEVQQQQQQQQQQQYEVGNNGVVAAENEEDHLTLSESDEEG